MGCDYYLITCLEIEFKDSLPNGQPHLEFVELDSVRRWYIPVEGEEKMTEEEYDECKEKYAPFEEPITIFENNRFITGRMQAYYTSENGLLSNIDMSRIKSVRQIQFVKDRQ